MKTTSVEDWMTFVYRTHSIPFAQLMVTLIYSVG